MLPEDIRALQRDAIEGDVTPDGILELCSEVFRYRAHLQDIGTDKHLADCPKTELPTMSCHCHQIMALEALMPQDRD